MAGEWIRSMRREIALLVPGVAPTILPAAIVLSGSRGEDNSRRTPTGAPPPDFALNDLAGGTVCLSEAQRTYKAVLVTFWATWCQGCVRELPRLEELDLKDRDRGLRLLTADAGEACEIVQNFVASG